MENKDAGSEDYVGKSTGIVKIVIGDTTYQKVYHYKTSNKEEQRKMFKEALRIVNKTIQES